MENAKQSGKTINAKNLLLFIVLIFVGLSSIITGFILDKVNRDNFVPVTTYTLSDTESFNAKGKYFILDGEEYKKVSPKSLGLYTKDDNDTYTLTIDEKFTADAYYSYDNINNSYVKATPKDLNIYTSFTTSYSAAWYVYILEIIGAVIFLLSFGYLYTYLQERFNLRKMNVKQMTVIAIFGALSVILYYFGKFNIVALFPSWLDIQFSDVPALLVSFMYGPMSGVLVIFVRFFCKLPGTSTVGVGEMADLLIGITLCVVAGLIYKKHRSLKGALCAMAFGMLAGTAMATVANWLILIPAYKGIAGYQQFVLTSTMDTIISGGNGVVTDDNFMLYYLFIGVIPFNLFRYVIVFAITLLLYKRLQAFIIMFVGEFKEPVNKEENDKEEDAEIKLINEEN